MLNAAIVQSALELGFIYGLVAMALFLSFRVLNIADMTNKSRGSYAYTIIDLESAASKEALDELRAIEGVSKVRVIK